MKGNVHMKSQEHPILHDIPIGIFVDATSSFLDRMYAVVATVFVCQRGTVVLVAGHSLLSASTRKGPIFRVFLLQIGGIEEKRGSEDSRTADHGRVDVGGN